MKIKDKMHCNEHSGEKLKVYCETCDELICRDFMDFKHVKQGHSCCLVKDVAGKYKELLASRDKTMNEVLKEGNVLLSRLQHSAEKRDREVTNIKSKINKRKEFLVKKVFELLDQEEESLLRKVDKIYEGEQIKFNTQIKEATKYLENIKTSVRLLQNCSTKAWTKKYFRLKK